MEVSGMDTKKKKENKMEQKEIKNEKNINGWK
jgi:hypothetical protein